MGGQLDGIFLAGSLPHEFIILIVTLFICLWLINFSLSPQAIGTLAACSLAMCGLRTRPRTDVDPPRVELPSSGGGHIVSPPPGR